MTEIPTYDLNPFLRTADIDAIGNNLQQCAPTLFRVGSMGTSRDGRDITVWTLTDSSTGPADAKPAVYLQGMVHSHELSGLTACIHIAHRLLQTAEETGLLKTRTFYIVPRINPDGAEFIQEHSGAIRSRRDDAADRTRPNTWLDGDVDHDGHVAELRIPDPCGAWALDPADPRKIVPRSPDTKPPYYTIRMEGEFLNYDGSPAFRNGNTAIDFNRNYAGSWSPQNPSAGPYPHSEPETRAVADFFNAHPNIVAAIDFHNGPLQVLAPPAVASMSLDAADEPLFSQAREAAESCGLGISTSCRYPNDGKAHNAPGNFVDWVYFVQGILGFVIELGSIADSILPREDVMKYDCQPCVYPHVDDWQTQNGEAPQRLFPWRAFEHPQLGAVELGGKEPRAYSLPARKDALDYQERAFQFAMKLARLAPQLEPQQPDVSPVGNGAYRVRLRLFNNGPLPTSVTQMATRLNGYRDLYVELIPENGAECVSMNRGQEIHAIAPYGSLYVEWFVSAPTSSTARLGTIVCNGFRAGRQTISVEHPSA